MFSVNELKKIKFSKSTMGGYKAREVEDFLVDITEDYSKLLKSNDELEKKIKALTQKLEEYRLEEDSIKSALVSAKQLGEKIVNEANEKADSLLNDARIKSETSIAEANVTSSKLLTDAEERAERMIEDAKRESVEVEESLKLQCIKERKRLDVMKNLVAKFKAEIIDSYKQHIEMLKTLPDVEADEETASSARSTENSAKTVSEAKSKKEPIEDIASDPIPEVIPAAGSGKKAEAEKNSESDENDIPEDKMPMSEMLADVSGETITFSKRSLRGDDEDLSHEEPEEMLVRKRRDPYIPGIDIVSYEEDEKDKQNDNDKKSDGSFGFSDDDVFSDGFDIDTNAFDDDDDDEDDDNENYGFFKSRK